MRVAVLCLAVLLIGNAACGVAPPDDGGRDAPDAADGHDVPGEHVFMDAAGAGAGFDAGEEEEDVQYLDAGAHPREAGVAPLDGGLHHPHPDDDGGPGSDGTDDGLDMEADAGEAPWMLPNRQVCAGRYSTPPVETGPLEDAELVETSGLAASILNPGVLWAHNDSGDSARLFALGTDGRSLGQVVLDGANFIDAEDIAVATCPDRSGPCLYLADTGDNGLSASEVALYIIPEPLVDPIDGVEVDSTDVYQRIRFQYAGGPVDAEALAVEPDGSRAYIFEKRHADSVRVFALDAPFSEQSIATATVMTEFAPPGIAFVNHGRSITAADLHLSGTRLLVRVYSGIYEYRFGSGQSVHDLASVQPTLITLGPLSEPQGEALSYDETGQQIFSVSEDTGQMPGQPLHLFACP